jgi:hypothetical protein
MKERPILMNGEMVRAILDGCKTQTRRPIKEVQELEVAENLGKSDWLFRTLCTSRYNGLWSDMPNDQFIEMYCPFGVVGDRLYVRESFQVFNVVNNDVIETIKPRPEICAIGYRATEEVRASKIGDKEFTGPWRPSIHMPKWATRIWLEITGIQVVRLQEITPHQALCEGVSDEVSGIPDSILDEEKFKESVYVNRFRSIWDKVYINNGFGWDVNPWVWAIHFRVVEK